MCEATAIIAAASTAANIGSKAYYGWQESQQAEGRARENASRLRGGAADALQRGESTALAMKMRAGSLQGQQRATAGASGFDLGGSSSIVDLIAGSREIAELDIRTARNNAAREAFGFAQAAKDQEEQADYIKGERGKALAITLLGGAAQAGGQGYAAYSASQQDQRLGAYATDSLDPIGNRPRLGRG